VTQAHKVHEVANGDAVDVQAALMHGVHGLPDPLMFVTQKIRRRQVRGGGKETWSLERRNLLT
jgi:hypothetical protein